MTQEIERKFLVCDNSYKQMAYAKSHIVQGYMTSGHGRSVRIRIRDEKGYITIKGPSNKAGISRYEWEREISLQDAQDLMKLCEPGQVDKYRYLIKSGKHTFEVDEFHGENEGLIIAEIELTTENESYEKPSFIGEEVTGDRRYYNSFLTKFPYVYWETQKGD